MLTFSSSNTTSTTNPCWYNHFQAVPCSIEVYFASLIIWFGGSLVSCCRETWKSPPHRETDTKIFDSLAKLTASNSFVVLRRVVTPVPKELWTSVLGVDIPSGGPATYLTSDTTPLILPTPLVGSSSSTSTSPFSTSTPTFFPIGSSKSQRSAWYSDDYLISIDPPACGIGNKFFIYSAYRIYAAIYQKAMNIHNKTWLPEDSYHLNLSSFSSANSSVTSSSSSHDALHFCMVSRAPTTEDHALVVAVFKKTTMYLQWSPLILSWQQDVRSWFAPFVHDSIEKSLLEYGSGSSGGDNNEKEQRQEDKNASIGGLDDLVIHLRTGDIWEERVKSASVTNGGFIFYTQPPAWFYAYVANKYQYKIVNVLTHVPNSQYVLSVVSALKNINSVHTVRVLTGSLQSDFGLLLRARNVIPSVSTFAWWSIFLGNGWANLNTFSRVVHIGRTGFFHPNSIHRRQFCFDFDEESDGANVTRHEYMLEASDTWQNTKEQRAKAFSHSVPLWFAEKYK